MYSYQEEMQAQYHALCATRAFLKSLENNEEYKHTVGVLLASYPYEYDVDLMISAWVELATERRGKSSGYEQERTHVNYSPSCGGWVYWDETESPSPPFKTKLEATNAFKQHCKNLNSAINEH